MAQGKAVPVYQRAIGRETFYVPAFEIKTAGRQLPREVIHDVMQVTYKDSVGETDIFNLTINNWDAAKQKFKYIGSAQKDMDPKHIGIFDPGQDLAVRMGYQQPLNYGGGPQLKLMMIGEITSLQPDFPSGGNPTLIVGGQNHLHRLRKRQHTWTWENMRDSDIAKELGQFPLSANRPGFGIEVRIDNDAASKEPKEPFISMTTEYDISFLMERARRHGYVVYLHEEDGQRPFIYFGPSGGTALTYKLEWGKSLTAFHPRLSTTHQVSSVQVHGMDRSANRPIVETAHWGDAGIKINRDLKSVFKAIDGKTEVITNKPVYNQQQAKALSRDTLLNQLKEMITASGSTVGLPDLRAGRKVEIAGMGEVFNGTYFVKSTTHTIGDGGYTTSFEARREQV